MCCPETPLYGGFPRFRVRHVEPGSEFPDSFPTLSRQSRPATAIGPYGAARSIVDVFNPRTSTDRDLVIAALRLWLAGPPRVLGSCSHSPSVGPTGTQPWCRSCTSFATISCDTQQAVPAATCGTRRAEGRTFPRLLVPDVLGGFWAGSPGRATAMPASSTVGSLAVADPVLSRTRQVPPPRTVPTSNMNRRTLEGAPIVGERGLKGPLRATLGPEWSAKPHRKPGVDMAEVVAPRG